MLAKKVKASRISILAISSLIAIKVVASIVTGSIAILADAVHSIIDLSGVIIGYIGVRVSAKPADEEHEFGHGKAENLASSVIAGLIFAAAGIIFYQAVKNLISGAHIGMLTVGIVITAVSIIINVVVSRYAFRVAGATDSLALEATARDMFADVLSSVAVLAGLILVRITGISVLDPIVAMLVAVLIAVTAFLTLKKSVGGLMDRRLPEAEQAAIIDVINEHTTMLAGYHKVRTRKAGSQRFIDFHLLLPKNVTLEEAHRISYHIEGDIRERLADASVVIHLEPCETECDICDVVDCSLRVNIRSKDRKTGQG
jgi:cation diffusion facilitator family transporter